uniref:hypothetical protein n=1 Tax=Paractinoplanes polyasparticus TaxID=2856853 RepID=UPI001C84D5F5|nr:hypothetical protein [Actinoplanes polyasparticus]
MSTTGQAAARTRVIPAQRTPAGAPETDDVRRLAATAKLASTVAAADDATRRRLRAAIHAIAHPIVFSVVTRKVEIRRSHRACLRGIRHLRPACLDAFQDDVDAVIDHLLAGRTAIDDLDAWLAHWAPRAAVDAHRRRRGARGALQRPRMTKALAAGLGHDRWLIDLALQILTWVGIPANAGRSLWPLDEWAQRRGLLTGDYRNSHPGVVEAEVALVLEVMRRRPQWYDNHVERPLGCKDAPLAPPPGDNATDPRPLRAAEPDELDDAHAGSLASLALTAIEERLRRGLSPEAAVLPVLSALFVEGSGADLIDRAPGAGRAGDDRLVALLADRLAARGLAEQVVEIVREGRHELIECAPALGDQVREVAGPGAGVSRLS